MALERPDIGTLSSIQADGSRKTIHPADVRGRFITARRVVFVGLIAIYLLLPTVQVNGHPAMHLDIAARHFYLFGNTFNAQDFWLVLFVLTGLGFTLLFLTSWLGRAWCGWACPQTVFLEGVYRPIERWFDGSRERRLRRAQSPWTLGGVLRLVGKHAAYLLVSVALAHVFLSLFVSTDGLLAMVRAGPAEHWVPFAWASGSTALLYFNFAWFREQLCVVICPYGRLQSVLLDKDSMVVGYDRLRGEPRGKLSRGGEAPQRGDCIDCQRCVVVCPTGIDIRNGLQMECLACAQCVDACDEVMGKIGRAPGLIRYDSQRGLAQEPKRVFRPRLAVYGVLALVALGALSVSLFGRSSFEATALRMPGAPYLLDGDQVRNQFELHLVNKSPQSAVFRVSVSSAPAQLTAVVPRNIVELSSLESTRLPVLLARPRGSPAHGPVTVEVVNEKSGERTKVQLRFLGPTG